METKRQIIPTFLVDRRVVDEGRLRKLSSNALKAYLVIRQYMTIGARTEVRVPDHALEHLAGIATGEIAAAQEELVNAGLIRYERRQRVSIYAPARFKGETCKMWTNHPLQKSPDLLTYWHQMELSGNATRLYEFIFHMLQCTGMTEITLRNSFAGHNCQVGLKALPPAQQELVASGLLDIRPETSNWRSEGETCYAFRTAEDYQTIGYGEAPSTS